MSGNLRFRAVLFDLDNTVRNRAALDGVPTRSHKQLYPRCEIGRAMGDRIVTYIRSCIDPAILHPPPAKATTEAALEKLRVPRARASDATDIDCAQVLSSSAGYYTL